MLSDGQAMNRAAAAFEYHEATKHRPDDFEARRPFDRRLIPRPYKQYRGLSSIALPAPRPTTSSSAAAPDGALLASLLHYSAGIVRRRRRPDGRDLEFRAASCTGAAYHIELYAVCGALEDVPAGVYHFGVHDERLAPLRDGDYRRALADAVCDESVAEAPVSLVLTSTFWRNAWRYEDRAYRHAFWDGGTIVANLLALAAAHAIEARIYAGFVDAELNRLAAVDGEPEAAVCVVALGAGAAAGASPAVDAISPEVAPLSPVEIEYPSIGRLHEASALASRGEVETWRRAAGGQGDVSAARLPGADAIEAVIERRGSTRRFRGAIGADELHAVLVAARGALPLDFGALTEAFVIVNAVEGLEAGLYVAGRGAEPRIVRRGVFRAATAHLALDQPPAGEAAANLYFMSDLEGVLSRLGNRGYRAAQLEGGVRGGRVYLAATALGLRASGLTFFDDEVPALFGDAAAGRQPMFLAVLGR